MAVSGLILSTLLSTFPGEDGPLACTFPAPRAQEAPISLSVEHSPSLFDTDHGFQVNLTVARVGRFDAAAGPDARTAQWDVVIRGVRDDSRVVVALKSDGTALLRLAGAETETRLGHCRGFETYLKRWTS